MKPLPATASSRLHLDPIPAVTVGPALDEPGPGVKMLPNGFSLLRLVGAPALVVSAGATGSRAWCAGLFGVMLLTDALDGFLARRLHAESDLGRRLDSYADQATVVAVAASLCLLWPEVVQREWIWLAAGLAACAVSTLYGLARWRIVPGFHTRNAKTMTFLLPVTLVALLADWSAVPFHLAVVLRMLSGGEELAIALLLPGYSGEMKSVWHAWCRKRRLTGHA